MQADFPEYVGILSKYLTKSLLGIVVLLAILEFIVIVTTLYHEASGLMNESIMKRAAVKLKTSLIWVFGFKVPIVKLT